MTFAIRYLTGVSNEMILQAAMPYGLGLLVTPDTKFYVQHIARYPCWAVDNACFKHPEKFVLEEYLAWLEELPLKERCLFATAPDVLGSAEKTLKRSIPVLAQLRARGYPAALVAQDGLRIAAVPWDLFDVLFIGGSTEWKLSYRMAMLCDLALMHGKVVHMGRVNSLKRMKIALSFGCTTVDGTYLKYGPKTNLPKLLSWVRELNVEAFA